MRFTFTSECVFEDNLFFHVRLITYSRVSKEILCDVGRNELYITRYIDRKP